MEFSEVTSTFSEMENTTKRLELTRILANLLKKANNDLKFIVYLVQGKLAPDFEGIEFGMSDKLIINHYPLYQASQMRR